MYRVGRLIALVVVSIMPNAPQAGVVDSPLPAPFTQHAFTVPGVVDNSSGLRTYFSCTNLDRTPVVIGVEVFGPAGGAPEGDASASSLSVAPGATVLFGTTGFSGLVVDSDLGVGPWSTTASARVLATSKKITCTAFVADTGSITTGTAWQLTIIAKTKQKAAN